MKSNMPTNEFLSDLNLAPAHSTIVTRFSMLRIVLQAGRSCRIPVIARELQIKVIASILLVLLVFVPSVVFAQAIVFRSDAILTDEAVVAPAGCIIETVVDWGFNQDNFVPDIGSGTLRFAEILSVMFVENGNPNGSSAPAIQTLPWRDQGLTPESTPYIQINVNTLTYADLRFALAQRRLGGNSPLALAVYYSLDGVTFNPSYSLPLPNDTEWHNHTFNFFDVDGLENNAKASFRIYGYQAGVGGDGLWQIDDIRVTSQHCDDTPTPTPAPAKLTIVLDAIPENLPGDDPDDHDFVASFAAFTLEDPARGEYPRQQSFRLNPGSYTVRKKAPSDYFVTAIQCSPGANAQVDLNLAQLTVNLAEQQDITCTFVSQRAGKVRARIYEDRNGDHKRDDDEPYLRGWQVTVRNLDNGQSYNKLTSDSGKANFSRLLPGNYEVCQNTQAGWSISQPRSGGCYRFLLTPGATASMRFGNYFNNDGGKLAVVNNDPAQNSAADVVDIYLSPIVPESDEEEGVWVGWGLRLFLPLVAAQ
jgi:hypothetical protein